MPQIIRDEDIKSDQEMFNVQLVKLAEPIIIEDKSKTNAENKVLVKCVIIIIIILVKL